MLTKNSKPQWRWQMSLHPTLEDFILLLEEYASFYENGRRWGVITYADKEFRKLAEQLKEKGLKAGPDAGD